MLSSCKYDVLGKGDPVRSRTYFVGCGERGEGTRVKKKRRKGNVGITAEKAKQIKPMEYNLVGVQ